MNEPEAQRLEMRWLPVTDAAGRTRMEATWVTVSTGTSTGTPTQEHAVTHAA